MMDVANRLSDAVRSTPAHVGEAARIWRALGALDLPDDDRSRLCRTVMDVANRMRDADRAGEAVLAWRVAHGLNREPDGRLRIRKTMMSGANAWTPAEDPGRRLGHALTAWRVIVELAEGDGERARVVATMNTVAGRLSDLSAYAGALRVFRAIGEVTSSPAA
ncbi:MAG: hypothetical protein ACOZNI_27050 [Myxococcota bacterium]